MSRERRRLLFAGRVQGVGFRFTAREVASQLAVTGFVRNLDDGRVELVVEGEVSELDRLTLAIRDRMAGKIDSVGCDVSVAEDCFEGFAIRF